MSLTDHTLPAFLNELDDCRLVARLVDGAYQLWLVPFIQGGQYTCLPVLLRSGAPRRISRKGGVLCYAARHGLQDKLWFMEDA